jgi:hypothetical protein
MGCCQNNACQVPNPMACDAGGAQCVACDPAKADVCAGGACACCGGPASAAVTAILDRLLHHAHVVTIDGPSFRAENRLSKRRD